MTEPSLPGSEPPNWLVIGIVIGVGVVVAAVYYGLLWTGVIAR